MHSPLAQTEVNESWSLKCFDDFEGVLSEMKTMGPFDLKNFPKMSKITFYFGQDISYMNTTYVFKNKKEVICGFNNTIRENMKNLKSVEIVLEEEEYLNKISIT